MQITTYSYFHKSQTVAHSPRILPGAALTIWTLHTHIEDCRNGVSLLKFCSSVTETGAYSGMGRLIRVVLQDEHCTCSYYNRENSVSYIMSSTCRASGSTSTCFLCHLFSIGFCYNNRSSLLFSCELYISALCPLLMSTLFWVEDVLWQLLLASSSKW